MKGQRSPSSPTPRIRRIPQPEVRELYGAEANAQWHAAWIAVHGVRQRIRIEVSNQLTVK